MARKILIIVGALIVAAAVFLMMPPSPVLLQDAPRKLSYEDAVAAFRRIEAATPPEVRPDAHPRLLTHGRPTEVVYVLLHGISNCPIQYDALAERLFNHDANVLIPRLPYHGETNRLTESWGKLTADMALANANEAIDIALGLGKRVVVAGISVNGTVAAWIAQNRADVSEAVLIAPMLAAKGTPDWLVLPSARLFATLPNFFCWWNPTLKEKNPGPPYCYPRFPTRAMAETIVLGQSVLRQAEHTPPRCGSILIITSAADIAVSNSLTARLAQAWKQHGGKVKEFEFPAEANVPHDCIDPLQPNARTDISHPQIIALLTNPQG